jgi:hypothetical protein
VELERVFLLRGRDPNWSGSVPQCVLDEVGERLLHSEAIDSNPDAGSADLERAVGVFGAPSEARGDAPEQFVEGDVVELQRQLSLVGAREQEEVRGELG